MLWSELPKDMRESLLMGIAEEEISIPASASMADVCELIQQFQGENTAVKNILAPLTPMPLKPSSRGRQFVKGQCGNPNGRPKKTRVRKEQDLIKALRTGDMGKAAQIITELAPGYALAPQSSLLLRRWR